MKRFAHIAVWGAVISATAFAQTPGYRGEIIKELNGLEMKFLKLGEAIPAAKYDYRAGTDEVRSVGQVLMHVAGANYGLPKLIGAEPPSYDKSVTDPAQIRAQVKQSFAHLRKAIESVQEADLEKKQKLFGEDVTYRYVMLFMTRHLAEHLGQLIAYSRDLGIVPPWNQKKS